MHTLWINRNYKYTYDKREYCGSLLKHGEFHWRYASDYERRSHEGSLSWHWGTTFCHLDCSLGEGDGNNELQLSLGIPYVLALWFHHTAPRWLLKLLPQHHYRLPNFNQRTQQVEGYVEGSYPEAREVSVRVHSGGLWWTLWMPGDEWSSTDPKWRRGSFHPLDALLGRRAYLCEDIGPAFSLTVAMPEGEYPVVLQQQRQQWWRPRWPWKPARMEHCSFDVRCPVGIPFPGKGENSWDCGEDGLFGMAFDVETPADACRRFGEVVMDYRQRYGGKRCAVEPWPQAPAERLILQAARQAARATEHSCQVGAQTLSANGAKSSVLL